MKSSLKNMTIKLLKFVMIYPNGKSSDVFCSR